MKSMTGYGRGECSQKGYKITVEVSSVNRKQSDISILLPRQLETLDSRLRDEINRVVARGRFTVRVTFHAARNGGAAEARLNVNLAKIYAREFKKLAKDLKLSETVTLELLTRAPGVLQVDEELNDAEAFWPAVEKALRRALAELVKMREREGANLATDLKTRVRIMRESAKRVEEVAPQVAERYLQQLRERIQKAGLEMPPADDERLQKEVVYFADRSDISEELTRLQSHFQQFDDCLQSKEPVGRTLEFLSQEMNREINTLGAKANDLRISKEIVLLKTELERFREQVQNVE